MTLPYRPLRILYVEDSDDDAQLVGAALRRLGYDPVIERVQTSSGLAAALQRPDWDLVLSDYNLPGFNALGALAALHASGRDLPFLIISGTIDEHQAVTALRAGAHDFITKLNLARLGPAIERELREAENRRQRHQAEARLTATLDQVQEAAVLLGRDWRLRYLNPRAAQLTQRTREELVGQNVLALFPWLEQSELVTVLRRCLETGAAEQHTSQVELFDGVTAWLDMNIQPVPEGLFILAHDITAQRQAQQALALAEAKYRSLVERVPAIIYIAALDASGSTSYVSPQVSLLGFTPEDYLADPELWSKNIHPDDRARVLAELDHLRNTHAPYRTEYRVLDREGRVLWLQDEAIVIDDAAGQPLFHQGVVIDITERKLAEARSQRRLDRLAALRAIDLAITSSLDLRLTLDIFLDQVSTQLRVDAVAVLLHNAGQGALSVAAARGFRSASYLQARVRLGEGRAGRAALERRLVSEVGTVALEPTSRRTGLLSADRFVSYYGLPLVAKGQLLGVLELFHRTPLAAEPEWVEFVEALAGQAAIAIENAKLFDGLQRSNQSLMLAYDATIEGWSRALDLRDKETEGHSQRVTELTLRLAQLMHMPEAELVHVRRGALLHDIGKMGVPDRILLKPGPLTDEEWVIMRQHPTFAHQLLSPISFLQPALDIPYCHHEKWDGTGYPRGLQGEAIPLAARVFAVVDVYDALTSERPYRPAWPADCVLGHLRALAGTHFDPRVVEAFLGMAP